MKTDEYAVPQHDILILREINYENLSAGGIIMANPGQDYDWLKSDQAKRGHVPDRELPTDRRAVGRYEVLAVGPGTWVDVNDELGRDVFMRRPMSAQKGDVILAMNGPKPFPCNGQVLFTCPDHMILAAIVNAGTKDETIVPKNDYVFAVESKFIHEGKDGVAIVAAGHIDLNMPGYESLPVRFRVVGVGMGPWAIRHQRGKPAEFAHRPPCVKVGDEFAAAGMPFQVYVGGAAIQVFQDNQIEAVFREGEAA
jgi:hypothetical protein